MERAAGILLPVPALPGPFGIGTLGAEARHFVDRLAKAQISYWQVLPLGQPAEDSELENSPYKSYSAFAGNTWLIDPQEICDDLGLLDPDEIRNFLCYDDGYLVDYQFARHNSANYLGLAFSRLDADLLAEVRQFLNQETWLLDYATFLCCKDEFDGLPWYEWPEEIRQRDLNALNLFQREHAQNILYVAFCQWLFYRQWQNLRNYANERGVCIFGDIPIYVASDSCDIWSRPELFDLDEERRPRSVAGVPPDYFAQDGQLWGNTLYNWEAMAADGYQWWLDRIAQSMRLYDRLRIDHFRAFHTYWAVPASAETAREGAWRQGPGLKLFQLVKERLGDLDIVAEDLGDIDEGVRDFLRQTGFPGMKVMQFAFDPKGDGSELPHHYIHHCCAYTGTHDNDTLFGWLWNASPEERDYALRYFNFPAEANWQQGGYHSPICRHIIRHLWASVADFVCIPVQDLCGFGSDTRVNVPGQPDNCWRFRVTRSALEQADFAWLKDMNVLYQRAGETKDLPSEDNALDLYAFL